MKARELVEILEAEIISGENHLDDEVQSIGAGDMMSDILALAKRNVAQTLFGLMRPLLVFEDEW